MRISTDFKIPVYQFASFQKWPNLQHCVTTRAGGLSQGETASLNLGFNTMDARQLVVSNRQLLAEALGIPLTNLCIPNQTHSTQFEIVRSAGLNYENTDALITSVAGICIAVLTADCVPVILFDPLKKVVAVAHCGWKGTVGGLLEKVIFAMKLSFGCDPQNIIAGIGPSIGPQAYEIGADVIELVEKTFSNHQLLLTPKSIDKMCFNLWKANELQLLESGLKASNIEQSEICTVSHPETFYSYRLSGGNTGRFATGIMLR